MKVFRTAGARRRLSAVLAATCLASMVGVAGAGVAGAAPGRARSSHGSHASVAAGVRHAKSELASYEKVPKYVAPSGSAFNISKAKGKTIYSIPVSSTILFEQVMEQAAKTLAAKYGIKWVPWTNQGKATQYVQGMNQAIAQHAAVITLFGGINPATLRPQISAASSAGIPVIAGHFYNTTTSIPSYMAGAVDQNFNEAARLLADWAISQTKGKAQAIYITSTTLGPPATTGLAGIKNEFSKYCPDCKVKYLNVPLTTWAKTITPEVQAALAANPGISYVLPAYDSMSTYVEAAIKAAGDTGKVHIATYNGDPPYMKQIAQKKYIQMEVGEDPIWQAYADLDLAMRLMTGQKAATEHVVLRVFDSSNIKAAGTPPKLGVGFGNAYVKGYAKLWKS